MNIKCIIKLSSVVCFIAVNYCALAQDFTDDYSNVASNREIIVNYKDSTVRARVAVFLNEEKCLPNLQYYWYWGNTLKVNVGGVYKNPLHGEYCVFDTKDNLICKGMFSKGLKNGNWRYWNAYGNLQMIQIWDNGQRTGEWIKYGNNNAVLQRSNYKNGVLHGETFKYINGKEEILIYKNGELISDSKKGVFFLRKILSRDKISRRKHNKNENQ